MDKVDYSGRHRRLRHSRATSCSTPSPFYPAPFSLTPSYRCLWWDSSRLSFPGPATLGLGTTGWAWIVFWAVPSLLHVQRLCSHPTMRHRFISLVFRRFHTHGRDSFCASITNAHSGLCTRGTWHRDRRPAHQENNTANNVEKNENPGMQGRRAPRRYFWAANRGQEDTSADEYYTEMKVL